MSDYKKIYAKRNFLGARETWMLGEDHLLLVKNNGYTENYRRFFFSDIQWIKTAPVRFSLVVMFLLTTVFCILLGMTIYFYFQEDSAEAAVFEITTGVWLVIFLLNYFIGRAGTVTIKTFSEKEILKVGTFRKALKLVRKLKPGILRVQGVAAESEILAKLTEREDAGTPRLSI